jgi:hypothetical protein
MALLAVAQQNRYVRQKMSLSSTTDNAQPCGAQVASKVSMQPHRRQIKLALDVHAANILVGRMIDGAKPPTPRTFKPAGFRCGPKSRWLWPKRSSVTVRH